MGLSVESWPDDLQVGGDLFGVRWQVKDPVLSICNALDDLSLIILFYQLFHLVQIVCERARWLSHNAGWR